MHAGGGPAARRNRRRPRTAAGQAIPAGASREGLSRTTRDKTTRAPPARGGYDAARPLIERAHFDSFDLENYNCSGQGLLIERAREKEQICQKLPMQLPPTSLSVPTAQRSVVGRWLILDRSEQRLTLLDSPGNLGPTRDPSRELQWNCFLHEKRPCGHCRLALHHHVSRCMRGRALGLRCRAIVQAAHVL